MRGLHACPRPQLHLVKVKPTTERLLAAGARRCWCPALLGGTDALLPQQPRQHPECGPAPPPGPLGGRVSADVPQGVGTSVPWLGTLFTHGSKCPKRVPFSAALTNPELKAKVTNARGARSDALVGGSPSLSQLACCRSPVQTYLRLPVRGTWRVSLSSPVCSELVL